MLTTGCQWEVGIPQKTVVEFIDGDAMDGMDETDSPTPPKTNMEPENGGPLEVWRFLLETIISRFHVNFWWCIFFSYTLVI